MLKNTLVLLVIALVPTAFTFGQDIEYVGSALWSQCYDVEVRGTYVYCTLNSGLIILDSSNPDSLVFVGKAYCQGAAMGIDLDGDYAYIAARDAGLVIVDISVPQNAHVVGCVNTPGFANEVVVSEIFAYVADDTAGLQVVDIANPQNPRIIGSFDTNIALDVAVTGQYVLVADYSIGMRIFSVHDPANPVQVGLFNDDYHCHSVEINWPYAYLNHNLGMDIIDISNPASPALTGYYSDTTFPNAAALSGDYLYLCAGVRGLKIINIANPSAPVLVGSCDTGEAFDVSIAGDYAFVADVNSLATIDISSRTSPILAGEYSTAGSVGIAFVLQDVAFVPGGAGNRLRVLDISNPTEPVVIGGYYSNLNVFAVGNYAYCVGGSHTLTILDISDPANPVEIGYAHGRGFGSRAIRVHGNYAYVASDSNYYEHSYNIFQIFDISDPQNPQLRGSISADGWIVDLAVDGDYAYVVGEVVDMFGGMHGIMRIINVSNSDYPVGVGHSDPLTYCRAIAIRGRYAYVADSRNGLVIFDVINPASPQISGQCDTPGYAEGVALQGDYAFVGDEAFGLQAVDISNPSNPVIVSSFNTPGYAGRVFAANDLIYLSDAFSLSIFRYQATGIDDMSQFPHQYRLLSAYPNPFNAATTISYSLSEPGSVSLSIYNLLGQKVATILEGQMEAGEHRVVWDAGDVPSGAYFTRLEAGERAETVKMILLK